MALEVSLASNFNLSIIRTTALSQHYWPKNWRVQIAMSWLFHRWRYFWRFGVTCSLIKVSYGQHDLLVLNFKVKMKKVKVSHCIVMQCPYASPRKARSWIHRGAKIEFNYPEGRFLKAPVTYRARKAILETMIHFPWKVSLSICFRYKKRQNNCQVSKLETCCYLW